MPKVPPGDETGRGGCGAAVNGCLFFLIIGLLVAIAVASVVVRK